MKFSDYYLSPASRFFSIVLALAAFVGTTIFAGWQIGVLAGAGVAILASVLVPLKVYLSDLPYLKMKEGLEKPFLMDQRVRFVLQNGATTAAGFLVLTQQKLYLLTADKGNHRVELSRDDVKSIKAASDTGFDIFLNDTQFIRVLSAFSREILQVLQTNAWG